MNIITLLDIFRDVWCSFKLSAIYFFRPHIQTFLVCSCESFFWQIRYLQLIHTGKMRGISSRARIVFLALCLILPVTKSQFTRWSKLWSEYPVETGSYNLTARSWPRDRWDAAALIDEGTGRLFVFGTFRITQFTAKQLYNELLVP